MTRCISRRDPLFGRNNPLPRLPRSRTLRTDSELPTGVIPSRTFGTLLCIASLGSRQTGALLSGFYFGAFGVAVAQSRTQRQLELARPPDQQDDSSNRPDTHARL
jgi:hypothetical protein